MNKCSKLGRIGILMGGPSTEREISLKSGKAVYETLKQSGIEALAIDIKTDKREDNLKLIKSHKINCAFVALHGRFGEDGKIQGILERLKIPYTGSGVGASRLAMDKAASKKIFEAEGLHVPKYCLLRKAKRKRILGARILEVLDFPLVIKPAGHGSSIGLSIVEKRGELEKALKSAFSLDEKVIAEEYVAGREFTVGILDERALPVVEIIPKKKFFDFEAKYKSGMTDYAAPAALEKKLAQNLRKTALRCHKLLGCFGCSRVDIILNEDDLAFVLEVNTIPGMTSTSLLPKAARTAGIEFDQLCIKLIELAYEKE